MHPDLPIGEPLFSDYLRCQLDPTSPSCHEVETISDTIAKAFLANFYNPVCKGWSGFELQGRFKPSWIDGRTDFQNKVYQDNNLYHIHIGPIFTTGNSAEGFGDVSDAILHVQVLVHKNEIQYGMVEIHQDHVPFRPPTIPWKFH